MNAPAPPPGPGLKPGMLPQVADIEVVLEALVNTGTAMWAWNPQTDEQFGGRSCQQLLGYPPEADFSTQAAWNTLIHPEDLPGYDQAYEAYLATRGPAFEYAYRARAADGRWRWVEERGRVVVWDEAGRPLRMVGILTDITERRRLEMRQQQMAGRLEEIARNLPGMLFQMVTHGTTKRFSYASQRSLEVLGVPAARLMEDVMAFETLRVLDDTALRDLERIDPLLGPGPWVTEYPIRRPDGEQRWLRVTSSSELRSDASVLWHGYMEDVTERRAYEGARQQAAEAVAASAAKTLFLSRMSHELRTPLNAVLGFTQLMELDEVEPLTPTQRRRMALVREGGEHLLQMIGDLLDLTRIESGNLQVELAPVEVATLARDCVALLGPQAERQRLRVEVQEVADPAIGTTRGTLHSTPHSTAADQPARALADPTRLRQVLLNLLSNAIKYNRPEGSIVVTVAGVGPWLRLSVLDTGVGIAASDIPGLFQPFNRLGAARSGIEGTGIGLAVTRALVQLMGGRIEATSHPGSGSVFTVSLPRPASDIAADPPGRVRGSAS